VACLFNSSLYDALIGDFFVVTMGLLLALGLRNGPTRLPVETGASIQACAWPLSSRP